MSIKTWFLGIALLAAAVRLGGCQQQATPSPIPAAVPFVEVILRDVHPLWGGRFVRLGADGALFVRVVTPGGKTTEHSSRVSPEQVAELAALLEAHHFREIEIPDRPGLPDEARPEIEVVWRSGERTVVAKWAGDTHPDFDAIYAWLVPLAETP